MKRRGRDGDPPIDAPLEEDEHDRQFVTALARGLEVLRAFQPNDVGLGNLEIAARTGLPKPTVSRLTHTLTRLGYLAAVEETGKYHLDVGVLALGYTLLAGMDIRKRARPLMQRLADTANGSVSLGSRERLSMVYLENCRGPGVLTLRLDVGSRVPIGTTAMGRAFLAALPPEERAYLLAHLKKRAREDYPRIRDGIDEAIEDLRTRGFTLSIGDWQPEVNAVGVPLISVDGSVAFALNCGGPSFTMQRERLEEDIGPKLVTLARALVHGPVAVTDSAAS